MLPATRARALLATSVSMAVLLAGCGAVTGEATGEGREVVASFYPLAWVTERVAGDEWTVTNLTTPGGEPHDLELSIGATADLTGADLVVWLEDFQPAVDDAVEANAEGAVLEAGAVVGLEEVTDHSDEGHAHEDHAEEDHGDEVDHEDDGHDHGDLDPHFWLDPARMATLAGAVADELATLDGAHAEDYQANAEQLAAQLEKLDRDYTQGLATCQRSTVVVSHDAFGYLEKYGLHFEPIAGLSPDAEPAPAALAELSDLIRQEGLTTVFSERLASPALAETLAADLGITTEVLDPAEGLTDETADDDYMSLMRNNLAALEKANGC